MSALRPITLAIQELRLIAEETRKRYTVDDEWPSNESDAHISYLRLLCIVRAAEKEWRDMRRRSQRLSQIESSTG